jgi:hypothetical protein
MNTQLVVQELLDREAIRSCLYRYSRACDRNDADLLETVYWPDASDRHGGFDGAFPEFLAWARRTLPTYQAAIHRIDNILIQFRPGFAAVESYFSVFVRAPLMDPNLPDEARREIHQHDIMGRYVDRFEKRGEDWRIAARTVVFDWITPLPVPDIPDEQRFGWAKPIGAKRPDDPVYQLLAQSASNNAAPA